MSESRDLLWEVGCEELPAWACQQLQAQVPGLMHDALVEARLIDVTTSSDAASSAQVLVGPRRFAVQVAGVRVAQEAVRNERRGPAERAAFVDGEPTKACQGFARSMSLDPAQLELRDGFVWGVQDLPSLPFAQVWPELAERVLERINFAKPMRWGSSPHRFVRPVRWMVTLLGSEAVEFGVWGVTSGRVTRTHRFLGAERHATIPSASDYVTVLEDAHVAVDQDARQRAIVAGLSSAADDFGGTWSDPGGVLAEVIHLVEQPTVIVGHFDERYLELPERVLVTAMQSHQRYFPIRVGDGLAPAFLTVMNADPAATASILPGYERVLAGRLDDAVFSFGRDRERGLDDMASSLGSVVFHARAGSLADRTARIRAIAAELARQLDLDTVAVDHAARLAKADQVSYVVQEFAELEGFAGSLYAGAAGYDGAIVRAIDQQFMPRSATASLPESGIASALALADKFDLLVTMMSIGEQATGSRDPHGLRRAAIGIMRIVLEHDLPVDIAEVITVAADTLSRQEVVTPTGAQLAEIRTFIDDRVEKALTESGVRVEAVRSARLAQLPRLQHLDGLSRALHDAVASGDERFAAVAAAGRRCANILTKSGDSRAAASVNSDAFRADAERELAARLDAVREPLAAAVGDRRFADAVQHAASLSAAVEAFFDRDSGVMVMDDDAEVRANRLALCQSVLDVLAPLGDVTSLGV